MRKTVILFFLSLIGTCAYAQSTPADSIVSETETAGLALSGKETSEALLESAATSYSKGEYEKSVAIYEAVMDRFGTSDKLYYNLGNAYYKCERLAPAILNYERALRLNPSDADARFNLEMCRARIVDRIDPIGMFLITRWYRSLGQSMSSNGWAWLSISLFLLFIVCLSAYFFARVRWLKKTGFYFGTLLLMLSILSLVYSGKASRQITNPDEAILFTLSVTAKSSPDKSGTDLFVLHEGTKMKIRSILGDWSEIELEDGNVGWLPSKDIQII
jgi:tetratricopeptide (TPR) repeat protein